jgi:hypothetical protein
MAMSFMKSARRVSGLVTSLCLAACNPSFAPADAPTAACKGISKAQFDAAKEGGATIGRGKIYASGIYTLNTGPGVLHCSKVPQSQQTCIRPNDFAIEFKLNDGRLVYLLIPKQTQYRFRVNATPTPCRVVVRAEKK